jgi:hypothetical protein
MFTIFASLISGEAFGREQIGETEMAERKKASGGIEIQIENFYDRSEKQYNKSINHVLLFFKVNELYKFQNHIEREETIYHFRVSDLR